MKKTKEKTILQIIADWLSVNGGVYKEKFEITYSDTALVVRRVKKKKYKYKVKSYPISLIEGLSPRTMNLLRENKIFTTQQVLRRGKKNLLSIPGIGERSIKNINKELGKLDLFFKENKNEN